MKTKLIIVEGLPGSGKSTTAAFIYDYLKSREIPVEIYYEGNLDHPADYDGVAYMSETEFNSLLDNYPEYQSHLTQNSRKKGSGMTVFYEKMRRELNGVFPDQMMDELYKRDIYELPLDKHVQLITERWQEFKVKAKNDNKIYIFECCFIQNPVTTAFVKYNQPSDVTLNYVQGLARAVKDLHPLLVYVNQNDISYTFKKALNERSKGWADFFINYYTGQGYGWANGLKGIEGTIEVLEQRAKLEEEILNQLDIEKVILNNSDYDKVSHEEKVSRFLASQIDG